MEVSLTNHEDLQEQIKKMREYPELYERTGEYWSEGEREKLRRMYLDGKGITEIALELQRAESAIMMQLSGIGLIRRARRRRDSQRDRCLCRSCDLTPGHLDCPRCCKGGQANARAV